ALILAEGRLVSIPELRQKLWPEGVHVDYQQGILRAVNKLRTSLGDSAAKPIYVETVNRSGYRFLAPVSWASETRSEATDVRPVGGQPIAASPGHVLHGHVATLLRPA